MTPDQYTAHEIDLLFRAEADRVFVFEDTGSVRSPGWYRAQCHECDWETSGSESVVEQEVSEHVGTHPLGRLLTAVGQAVRERGEKLERLPETLALIWKPLPGTNWAVWDLDGRDALIGHCKFHEPVSGERVRVTFGITPFRPYGIAEFSDERWALFVRAVEDRDDTSFARWTKAPVCDVALGSTDGRTRCDLPAHGPLTKHFSTRPDGQGRVWTDNESE